MAALGPVFGESILRDKKVTFSSSSLIERSRFFRFYLFITLLVAGFSLLFIRLFSLTIIEGNSYKNLASENRIREINQKAPRGVIYDRNKIPLVRNIPVFTTIDGEIFFNKPQNSKELFIESSTRDYIYGEVFGNLLGYIGEVNPIDLKKLAPKNYLDKYEPLKLKDYIGKMGIEEAYDKILRGADGQEMYEADATGRYVRTLGRKASVAGRNVVLNIDLELQKTASEQLKDKRGAVVASNPITGEILALYSSPSFDPNKILKAEDLESVFDNQDQPLFNRGISGAYPPGSTFKIITALAGLDNGAINRSYTVEDTGVIKVGEKYSYANWYFTQYGKTEGHVDLVRALKRSNDIYFYKAGEKTGIENISKWAKKLGTGKTLGIDIKGEASGLMPDPEWRQKEKGEDWFLGDTYITAIGQGDILTTPLQVNFWTNTIANGGKLCKPFLSTSINSKCDDLNINKDHLATIQNGLVEACNEGGTGWPLFNFGVENDRLKIDNTDFFESNTSSASAKTQVGITTACKTGTAEFGDPDDKTHAWFTVYAPVRKPQISVTVLVEEGGEGSSVAGPIAREILKKWFEK